MDKSGLQMPSSPVKTTESSVAVRKILQDENEEIRSMHQVHNHNQNRSRCARCGRQKESVNSDGGSCSFCRSHVITQPPPTKDDNSIVTVEPIYDVTTSISNDLYDETYFRNGKANNSNYTPSDVPRLGRKWRHFPGKNKFYCEGRVMTAPSIRFCVLSFGLIILTFVLFIIFDGPYLAEKLTLAIPIVGALLFLSVVVNMLKTSCSDPGILPRASQQESEYIEKSYGDANNSRPPPRTKDIVVNGQTVKSKYCFTCKMFRPPRASHCGVCDNCVDRFDHHCPFLGNCIGKRNYRSFYAFIVSLSLLAVFVLSCSITHLALLSKETGNFLDALRDSPTSAVVVLISFFGMWTVIGLAGFHTYLIAMEQTTNEDIKGMFGRANSKNPYSRGNFCQNCCFVLCGPAHPSLIDPRGYATLDFLASLPKTNLNNDQTGTSAPNNKSTSIKANCTEARNTSQNHGQTQSGGGGQGQNQVASPGGQFSKNVSPTSPSGAVPNSNGKILSPPHNMQAPTSATSGVFSGKFPTYLRDQRPKGRNHIESVPAVVNQPSSSMVTMVDLDGLQNRQCYSSGHHLYENDDGSNGNLSGSGCSSGSSICEHSQSNGQGHPGHGHVSLSMVKLDFDTQRRGRDGTSTSSSGTHHARDSGNLEPSLPSSSYQNHHSNNTKESCPHTKSKQNRPAISHNNGGRLENMTMINSPLHLDTIM